MTGTPGTGIRQTTPYTGFVGWTRAVAVRIREPHTRACMHATSGQTGGPAAARAPATHVWVGVCQLQYNAMHACDILGRIMSLNIEQQLEIGASNDKSAHAGGSMLPCWL